MSDHNDDPLQLAKQYGLSNAGGQHCDALLDDVEPIILGQIRLVEEEQASDTAATNTTATFLDDPLLLEQEKEKADNVYSSFLGTSSMQGKYKLFV